MSSAYSVPTPPVFSSMVDRLSTLAPRRTRYPVILSSCGSFQLRVRTLWPTRARVSPVGAAGGSSFSVCSAGWGVSSGGGGFAGSSITLVVEVPVQGPLHSCAERFAV